MVRAVFFDWTGTLAHSEPERDEVVHGAARELGIELPLEGLLRGIYAADDGMPSGSPARWHEGQEEKAFIRWWAILLAEVGAEMSRDEMLKMTRRLKKLSEGLSWALYDDALPTLRRLRQLGLVLGLITSLGNEVKHVCTKLGIGPYLDFVVTSSEVGSDKPGAPIFLAALERARATAAETVYVGDQYGKDVLGARKVGIKPILIDRYDIAPEVNDCPRLHNLAELVSYL